MPVHGDIAVLGDVDHVHRVETRLVVDAQDTDHQQGRTTHQHQGQLHGRVVFAAAAPNANQQVHGDKGHLVEHEHREEVDRDEEAEHTGRQQHEPQEELLGQGVDLPRSEDSGKDYNGREQQHGHRYTVHADGVVDVERRIPHAAVGEQHRRCISSSAFGQKLNESVYGQRQQ